jgi:hypothetical protein
MTPLDKTLKRALKLNGRDYVVTLTPDALKVTAKGHRIGVDLKWTDLISGESALAVALHASLGKFHDDVKPVARPAAEPARKPITAKTQSSRPVRKIAARRTARRGKRPI